MQNKVGIITFEWVHNKREIGSTRIRVKWPLRHWPEAEEAVMGKKYDVIIYQKAYLEEHAEMFDGIKILDICDPDWLDGAPIMKMINRCDAVTTSSPVLAELIQKWTDKPVVHIPDRIDPAINKQRKIHKGTAKKVFWFGYSHNSHTLKYVFPYLKKLNLDLTFFSEKPYNGKEEVKWKKFDFNKLNDEMIKHDIVLFPPSFKFKDKYKSNNKSVHAWSLGMPAAHTYEDLQRFMSAEGRIKEAEQKLKEVYDKYTVDLSVAQYRKLIKRIKNEKQRR